MWRYSDAIEVNQSYFEVFTEEADHADASYWKSFIPHASMVDLVDGLIRALEGASRKSLWIHGAYGTGKTHAQFVLKHMLEDPWSEVHSYFEAWALSKDIERRLQALRQQGDGLVVYRSSSASVNSNQKLMAELQLAIKMALQEKGLAKSVTPTLFDHVLDRVNGRGGVFDWQRAFDKYRSEFLDFDSAADVASRLASLTDPDARMDLMARVVEVMDREGFFLLDDPGTVKEWLKEVIKANHLSWLVFIWDEFTDFFLNVSSLSGLQELAHLTTEAPFYLLLATHRSPETLQLGRNPDWSKLLDRFSVYRYEMEPVTAYRLMRNVLRTRPEGQQRWQLRRSQLWAKAKSATTYLMADAERAQDFQNLTPIHPYAAYLLSQVSREFSSSQRTLFRFLKRSETGSFLSFLHEHPREGWEWYTADSLWDYFFTGDSPDLPSGLKDVVSYYRSRERGITTEEEARAFKATLLLLGLSREISSAMLLQPTLTNLRYVFFGTSLADRIDDIMEELCRRDLIRGVRLASNDRQFTIPIGSLDRDTVDRYKAELSFPVEAAAKGSIGSMVLRLFDDIGEPARRRQALHIVSADELTRRRERVTQGAELWQTSVAIVLPQDEKEAIAAADLMRRLAAQDDGSAYVLVDVPFGLQRWDGWCEDKATARWYKDSNDTQNAVFLEDTAFNRVRTWLSSVRAGRLRLFFRDRQMNAVGVDGYLKSMAAVTAQRFPYRPELLSPTSTLYSDRYGAKGAGIGLGASAANSAPYNVLVRELTRQGLWPDARGYDPNALAGRSDHPLGGMKAAVSQAFDDHDIVDLNELYLRLQAPPYGLLPCPAAVVLMGLLLRDYVDGYYWRDGVNTRPLDRTKMAEIVNGVMHGGTSAALSQTTADARRFCEAVRVAFALPEDETRFPENAREAVRRFLTHIGYPIWALRYVAGTDLASLPKLHQLLADTEEGAPGLSAERLSSLMQDLRPEQTPLTELVQGKRFREGMRRFVEASTPQLLESAERVGVTIVALMGRLRDLMNEEVWLWKESEVVARLPELRGDLEMVLALNGILRRHETELASAVDGLRQKLQAGKLPLVVLREQDTPNGVIRDGGGPIAAALTELDRFVRDQSGYQEKVRLAASLTGEKRGLQHALDNCAPALRCWIARNLDVSITLHDAAEMLNALPDLSQQSDIDVLKTQIGVELDNLTKQKVVAEVESTWAQLTGSSSPEDWSQAHGVPIHWLLDGPEFAGLLSLMRGPFLHTQPELEQALALMEEHCEEVAHISASGAADSVLLAVALGQYSGLVSSAEDIGSLRALLLERVGGEVHAWDRRHVMDVAREWAERLYKKRDYARVMRLVDEMPGDKAKTLLKNLLRDPGVGLKAFQQLEQKE